MSATTTLSSDTLSALHALMLNDAPNQWVNALFDLNFTEVPPLAVDLGDEATATQALHSMIAFFQQWAALNDQQQQQQQFWLLMAENSLSHRALIAVIFFHMNTKDTSVQVAGIAAAAYLALLRIPGSLAYGVFQPTIISTVCTVLDQLSVESASDEAEAAKPAKRKRDGASQSKHAAKTEGHDATLQLLLSELASVLNLNIVQQDEGATAAVVETLFKTLVSTCDGLPALNASNWSTISSSAAPAQLVFNGLFALCQHTTSARAVFKQMVQVITFKSEGAAKAANKAATLCTDFVKSIACSIPFLGDLTKMLVQHSCMQASDKADARGRTTALAASLIQSLPTTTRDTMLHWVVSLSRNSKVALRIVAVDLLLDLLQLVVGQSSVAGKGKAPVQDADCDTRVDGEDDHAVIEALVSRCSDKTASVRSKALGNLAAYFEQAESQASIQSAIEHLLVPRMEALGSEDPEQSSISASSANVTSVSSNVLVMLRKRVADTKSQARRSAVQALTSVLLCTGSAALAREDIQVIHDRCLDSTLSVRKQALVSLTDLLLKYPKDATLQDMWLHATLPLVLDGEESVSVKCVDVYAQILLDGILSEGDDANLATVMLRKIDAESLRRQYVHRLCSAFHRENRLTAKLIKRLCRLCVQNQGGWVLLAEIASRVPKLVDAAAIASTCETTPYTDAKATFAFGVLASIAGHLPAGSDTAITDKLKADILASLVPPQLLSTSLAIISKVEEKHKASHRDAFAKALLEQSASRLSDIAVEQQCDELMTANLLFAVGEAAAYCPQNVSDHVVSVVQLFIASTSANTAASYAPSIRAHAFTALGKLCLQCEDLAKKSLPLMAKELEICADPAVRNNIIVIMADLCVRYTTVMDNYVSCFAVHLKDSAPLVRRTTLTLLTRLFSEDYVKMRGAIFFQLLASLVDEDQDVRGLGKFCLLNIVLVKQANVFVNNFVESIFVFNDFREVDASLRFDQSERERQLFSLKGDANSKRRAYLYAFMLENASELDKLNISQRLCQEILGGVVDGKLKLQASLEPVLRDTMAVLVSKEVKLKTQRANADDEDNEDAAKAKQARATVITKMMKKNTAENIVPIIIALKNIFEKQHSPLLKQLLLYLRELMKDYKDEVAEIMAADKQLASEIMFDIEKLELEAKKAATIRAGAASANTSAVLQSPRLLNQPMVPPSPYISPAMMSMSPKTPFSVPRLRTAVSSASVSTATPLRSATPLRASMTPAKATGPAELSWVRTPAQRVQELAKQSVIRLQSPMVAAAQSQENHQWNVPAPNFESPARQKRSADTEDSESPAAARPRRQITQKRSF